MGISKGRGMAWAKRKLGRKGTVTVMLGDGELQEGQIWESLQVTAHQKLGNLTVIIDHNKVQSDLPIDQIVSLGDLEAKLKTFNWEVRRCDGHDYAALDKTFTELDAMAAKFGQAKGLVVEGHSGRTILDFAEDNGIDLIVVASHRPGMGDMLLGSTATQVVRHANCAVHVLR